MTLVPLPTLVFPIPFPLFLAGTNRPSRKAWDHSIFSSASIRLNSARQIRSHVPSSDHGFNRRQQVVGEPYCRGMSAQVQPAFNTNRMPFRVFFGSVGGRPGAGCGLGYWGAIMSQWTSVSSCLVLILIY